MFRLACLLIGGAAMCQASSEPGLPNVEPVEMVATSEPGSTAVPAEKVIQSMETSDQPAPEIASAVHYPGSGVGSVIRGSTPGAAEATSSVHYPGSGVGKTILEPPVPMIGAPPKGGEDEGDEILDQIEDGETSTTAVPKEIGDWNMNKLVEETKKAEEHQKVMERKHAEMKRKLLREQALKLKKKAELDDVVIEAEKKCVLWTSLKNEGEADMYELFKEAVNSSLAARDGSRHHQPPVLVEKQLHITNLGINAIKCHASYIEQLGVFVSKACDVSEHVRKMLTTYIETPNEKLILPSIELVDTPEFHIPTRKEINVLKLTAANAHAKVNSALRDYQMHQARLEALEIEDETDLDEVGAENIADDDEKKKILPHLLPIEILFQHIVGRAMNDEPPKGDMKVLEAAKKKVRGEMEDCFGDGCEDPKEYDGKLQDAKEN